jgi:hypothetical protein
MQVSSVHNVLGWFFDNRLKTETRTTYHYDDGNEVTVIESRFVDVHLYDHTGKEEH